MLITILLHRFSRAFLCLLLLYEYPVPLGARDMSERLDAHLLTQKTETTRKGHSWPVSRQLTT